MVDEEHDAPGAEEKELQRIPQHEDEHEVEPFAPALLNEPNAGDCDQQVDDAEEHGGDPPFETAPGAQLVEKDVRRHPPAEEDAGVDAGVPKPVQEHDVGLTFARRTIAVWLVLSGSVPEIIPGRSASPQLAGIGAWLLLPTSGYGEPRQEGIPPRSWRAVPRASARPVAARLLEFSQRCRFGVWRVRFGCVRSRCVAHHRQVSARGRLLR